MTLSLVVQGSLKLMTKLAYKMPASSLYGAPMCTPLGSAAVEHAADSSLLTYVTFLIV